MWKSHLVGHAQITCTLEKPLCSSRNDPFLSCPCHMEHILSEIKFICLRAVPLLPVPKWVLHSVRSSASSFNLPYPLFFLRSSSSCLSLLPRLPITSLFPSIFLSIKLFWMQFLRKMWPIQLAFILFIIFRIFLLSLSLFHTSSFLSRLVQMIFSIPLQHHI